ncbi:MAG: hypothetical protein H6702_19450 [Myxococcales bacterium]|nr:hypothetical protein [Myxococcales bacterium]
MARVARGGAGGAGGAGGGGDPCAGVMCDGGQRCNPMTGNCQQRPAGGCEADGDCTAGACLTEADSEGGIPGGFCRVECSDDGDCDGARCLPSGETSLCFQVCGPARACRDGWACLPTTGADGAPDGGSICLPDCRVAAVGCGPGLVCNDGTGGCEPAPPQCRYPCQAGEECRDGRCIRANDTCATDYHCELSEQCLNGRCIVGEFQDCLNINQCSPPDQTCFLFNNGLDGGFCLFSCGADDDCPLDRTCFTNDRVCYWRVCGASEQNGTVFGACNAGGQNQWQGTCLPVQVPDPGQPQIGLCLEAGNVPEGGACDAQVDGRGAADRALQCAPGMLCFDDPDDSLDPARNFGGRGACRQLCDPRIDRCDTPGRACIDFSTLDDPNTPDNETRYLGLCLQTDCTVVRNDCNGGQMCRPYSLVAREGQCTAAGQVALGQPCTQSADCADSAFCANAGAGPVCLQICDPAAPACAAGTQCRNEQGWGFGVCL